MKKFTEQTYVFDNDEKKRLNCLTIYDKIDIYGCLERTNKVSLWQIDELQNMEEDDPRYKLLNFIFDRWRVCDVVAVLMPTIEYLSNDFDEAVNDCLPLTEDDLKHGVSKIPFLEWFAETEEITEEVEKDESIYNLEEFLAEKLLEFIDDNSKIESVDILEFKEFEDARAVKANIIYNGYDQTIPIIVYADHGVFVPRDWDQDSRFTLPDFLENPAEFWQSNAGSIIVKMDGLPRV